MMKPVFARLFKPTLLLPLALFCWALWAQAQPATRAPAPSAPAGVEAAAAAKSAPNVWLTFGLDRVAPLRYAPFADIPLWQYLSSLIYILLAFYFSRLLDGFITGRAKKWAKKTTTQFDDLVVEMLRGPVRIVTFVILLHIGMQVYSWPAVLEDFFSKALKIIVAVSITYVLLKSVDAAMRAWRDRATTPENEQFSKQLLPLISKSLKVFVVTVAILVTSQNLGLNVTGLIASLSIGGLAVGLAAQDTLANLFGAVAVLVDKPFKVGDRIQLDTVDGTVESIGFRSTRVRSLDGHLVTVPNKTMGNATITNVTARSNIKTMMNIGITYDTPPERVKRALQILEEVFRGHPKTSDLLISFNKFESSSLNILVVHWWGDTDYNAYLGGIQQMNLNLKERFDAERIEFAFPTQTLYVKQDSKAPAAA
ncbi:MAG: mechanosensitive ion channel family protein [Verrucomicrobia bacterium]|nr:mechanosensitive ion channel family protein [Verrucomicrobiota bacterium]